MVFHDKYELLTLRGSNEAMTLQGREIFSARPVLVHLLAGGSSQANAELLRALNNLPAGQRKHVLDSGDHDGIPYVITNPLPGNVSLRNWVASAAVAAAESREPAVQAAPASKEPGEFTRLFQAAEKPPEPSRPDAPAAAPEPAPEPAPAGPGEFTRLFRAAGKPPEPIAGGMGATPEPSPQSAPEPAPAEPGEFTRLFQAPVKPPETTQAAAPAAPPAAPAVASGSGPDESTRLFQPRGPSRTPQSSAPGEFTRAMQTPLAPESGYSKPKGPAAQPPSEFTRIMQGSALAQPPVARQSSVPPAPSRESSQLPGEFTRIFGSEAVPSENLAGPAPSQVPLPQGGVATGAFSKRAPFAGTPTPSGPSEFTQMIGTSSPPPRPAAPKAAPPAAAGRVPALAKTNKSYLPLILVLGGLFLLVVILILIFALMR